MLPLARTRRRKERDRSEEEYARFACEPGVKLQDLGNGRATCPQSRSGAAGIVETVKVSQDFLRLLWLHAQQILNKA